MQAHYAACDTAADLMAQLNMAVDGTEHELQATGSLVQQLLGFDPRTGLPGRPRELVLCREGHQLQGECYTGGRPTAYQPHQPDEGSMKRTSCTAGRLAV